jgi:hypothetical protein
MAQRPRARRRAQPTPLVPGNAKKRGIYQNAKGGNPDANLVDKYADFSYESDELAQLIVEIWLGGHSDLTTMSGTGTVLQQYQARTAAAKIALQAKGIYLEQPLVITEAEYDAGFSMADAGLTAADTSNPPRIVGLGVVLVVPDDRRATKTVTPSSALLDTAKMLMAVTPNGI